MAWKYARDASGGCLLCFHFRRPWWAQEVDGFRADTYLAHCLGYVTAMLVCDLIMSAAVRFPLLVLFIIGLRTIGGWVHG